ncbi:MAG: diguanylate cyclase [Candidatus Omnitrophica bacterium]|nr:diguanylate cyclase [Candidatus Omnitrophota bacterium]MBU2473377.1 diguanylate cyclase [Candidatus Omnitrophota bacterium]
MDTIKKILIISSDNQLKEVLRFCFDGWGYEVILRQFSEPQDIEKIKKISPDVIVIDIQSARKEQLAICRQLKENFTTAFIPVITLINKRQLRAQLLNLKQGVDDYLIKPPDPLDLRIRIEMAVRRSQHSIYASSLTGLPGSKIFEDVLNEKFKKGNPFSFAYLDIDNFKSFNDVYGYRRGDGAILQTAYLLIAAVRNFGNPDDFVGHIGGDDFVFISSLDKYQKICRNFIKNFDQLMPFHYSETDRQQGFVVSRDRSRKLTNTPLMTVSVAVVNKEYTFGIENMIQLNEKVAEIKRYLKAIPGSKFMVDRRDTKINKDAKPEISQRKSESFYKPLGQILVERQSISAEQLNEALLTHWKKGVALGEILKESGFLSEQELSIALNIQKAKSPYLISEN